MRIDHLASISLSFALLACGEVESTNQLTDAPTSVEPPTVSLTVMKKGTGTGTVTSGPAGVTCGGDCGEAYAPGTIVTLTAMPDAGTTFVGWTGGGCTGTDTCVVTMNGDTLIEAAFARQQFTVTVTPNGNGTGTVTSTPAGIDCGATCSMNIDYPTMVTLTAAATNGSTFAGWSGGGCSGTGSCVQIMTASSTVTARFTCPGATFTYNGTIQDYVVPACASQVHLEAYGAQGASGVAGGAQGGLGGYAKGDRTVTPGQKLTVVVGGQGARFNGGTGVSSNANVAHGGDASEIWFASPSDRILVAGGGGGGGTGEGSYLGGDGGGGTCGANYCGGGGGKGFGGTGGPGGASGGGGIAAVHAGGGGGGGASSGGGGSCETGFPPTSCGGSGGPGVGGKGDPSQRIAHPVCYTIWNGTAGGGGGYYGGGGTSVGSCGGGGGGGGSSYTGSLANPVMTGGVRSGNGLVIITPF